MANQQMHPVPFGYNHMSDVRNNESLRAMNQMMHSMMSFQHNNFKAMMSSHTTVMNQMIDKVWSPKKKRNRQKYDRSSNYDRDHEEFE